MQDNTKIGNTGGNVEQMNKECRTDEVWQTPKKCCEPSTSLIPCSSVHLFLPYQRLLQHLVHRLDIMEFYSFDECGIYFLYVFFILPAKNDLF